MAVKIVRQPNKIALLGSPTSAAAMSAGHEGAPAALRAAGLIERLTSIGYSVTDLGDDPQQLFQQDDESPRARNIPRVIAALEALKPRVEQAVKSGALPVILSGDCSVVLATIAGVRRYFRNVGLIYVDRDADLNTPATTRSGCVDGMVISHVVGRGAAELVRFWSEPPLVREPDLALFGTARLDPPEEDVLARTPLRRYLASDVQRQGAAAAAQAAIDGVHAGAHDFVLHFDVDVIADFSATNYPAPDGLRLDEVRDALEVFARQKHLAAIDVSAYNPAKDSDGSGAKRIVDLLAGVFQKRLEALQESAPAPAPVAAVAAAEAPAPEPVAGEAWSPDSLAETSDSAETSSEEPAGPDESASQ
ncbi:MAG TPA: arginase family protein [Verrucomicrobiae bacterium]|nr:arginase family protein [Verrucomicrobiae bacterium]